MSTQIAVRIPDDLMEFLDHEVAAGHTPSRAGAVLDALRAYRKRCQHEEEIAILSAADPLDEHGRAMRSISEAAAETPLDLD